MKRYLIAIAVVGLVAGAALTGSAATPSRMFRAFNGVPCDRNGVHLKGCHFIAGDPNDAGMTPMQWWCPETIIGTAEAVNGADLDAGL